jgi:hypothetical protein
MTDREVHDLRNDQLGGHKYLRYVRYDVEISDRWLKNELRLALEDAELH